MKCRSQGVQWTTLIQVCIGSEHVSSQFNLCLLKISGAHFINFSFNPSMDDQFETVPSDLFLSNFYYQLKYFTGKFQDLQLIVPVVIGAVD